MRLLFATPTELSPPRGGRAMLAHLHRSVLGDLLGRDLGDVLLRPGSGGLLSKLGGGIDGATPAECERLIARLDAHGADALWLDGSNLGAIARAVKRRRPRVRILTVCHNVEARFFLGALHRARTLHAAGVMVGNYAAERHTMRYSDDVITLSDRDSAGMLKLYGRRADHVLPMALADRCGDRGADATLADDAPLLFVGGDFYANRAGIDWFAHSVAPHITIATHVVGHGMEAVRQRLERCRGVRVIGAVESLEAAYRGARLVIAPIFDGSGMKTKVAEALMFGKRVAGTSEAFSGYGAEIVARNALCDTADAFITAIRAGQRERPPAFDGALRALYERDHSPAATRARLLPILGLNDV